MVEIGLHPLVEPRNVVLEANIRNALISRVYVDADGVKIVLLAILEDGARARKRVKCPPRGMMIV